jgi:hypothetical protein
MGYLSVSALAQKVGEMRKHIRGIYIDIRANGRTMKDLHQWLNKVPKKRIGNEIPAAEDYEDDVDQREQRVLKRTRRNEEEDPTYRDTIIAREAVIPETGIATRAARPIAGRPSSPKKKSSTSVPVVRQPLPTQSVARPPPSAMDRVHAAVPLSASFGQGVSHQYHNEYPQPQVSCLVVIVGDQADEGFSNRHTVLSKGTLNLSRMRNTTHQLRSIILRLLKRRLKPRSGRGTNSDHKVGLGVVGEAGII